MLLHLADAAVRDRLAALDAAANGADPLRYAFIVSQVLSKGHIPLMQAVRVWSRFVISDLSFAPDINAC